MATETGQKVVEAYKSQPTWAGASSAGKELPSGTYVTSKGTFAVSPTGRVTRVSSVGTTRPSPTVYSPEVRESIRTEEVRQIRKTARELEEKIPEEERKYYEKTIIMRKEPTGEYALIAKPKVEITTITGERITTRKPPTGTVPVSAGVAYKAGLISKEEYERAGKEERIYYVSPKAAGAVVELEKAYGPQLEREIKKRGPISPKYSRAKALWEIHEEKLKREEAKKKIIRESPFLVKLGYAIRSPTETIGGLIGKTAGEGKKVTEAAYEIIEERALREGPEEAAVRAAWGTAELPTYYFGGKVWAKIPPKIATAITVGGGLAISKTGYEIYKEPTPVKVATFVTQLGTGISLGYLGAAHARAEMLKQPVQTAEYGKLYPTKEGATQVSKIATKVAGKTYESQAIGRSIVKGKKVYGISEVVTDIGGKPRESLILTKAQLLPEKWGYVPSVSKAKIITKPTGILGRVKGWLGQRFKTTEAAGKFLTKKKDWYIATAGETVTEKGMRGVYKGLIEVGKPIPAETPIKTTWELAAKIKPPTTSLANIAQRQVIEGITPKPKILRTEVGYASPVVTIKPKEKARVVMRRPVVSQAELQSYAIATTKLQERQKAQAQKLSLKQSKAAKTISREMTSIAEKQKKLQVLLPLSKTVTAQKMAQLRLQAQRLIQIQGPIRKVRTTQATWLSPLVFPPTLKIPIITLPPMKPMKGKRRKRLPYWVRYWVRTHPIIGTPEEIAKAFGLGKRRRK